MRNPYQRKAASKNQNIAYDPLEIYRLFIETIVHQGHVIALYQDGWALCATPTGQRSFAMWQSKGLAQLLVKDNWAGYEIQSIGLSDLVEKVIPFLRSEKNHGLDEFKPRRAKCLGCTRKIIIRYQKLFISIFNAEA